MQRSCDCSRSHTWLAAWPNTCVWLAVIGLFGGLSALPAADSGPSPVFTNKIRFRIPFRSDSAEMQRLEAREVQLFASTDHGTRWRMVDKVEPRAEHFDYSVPADGEYWFAVRTLDAFNRLHPQSDTIEPGLKVVVDATPPVLELNLTELEPGKVELRWTAADDHLDATKLRLEYRQSDSPEWQQVGVVPQAGGQTTWSVPAGGVVSVRGSIGDLAGNVATAEREINLHPAPRGPQSGSGTEYRAPVATMPQQPVAAAAQTPNELPRSLSSAAAPPESPKVVTKSGSADSMKSDQEFFGEPDPGPKIQPRVKDELVAQSRVSRVRSSNPVSMQQPQAASGVGTAMAPINDKPIGNQRGNEQPAEEDFEPTAGATPRSPGAGPSKDDSQRSALVKNRDFQIGYSVDDVGPSGLGKVELFITQDAGQKWFRYGTDPDNRSPFAVHVPEDGVYGFALRVRNGAGIGDDPPRPGEKPSIVVTVDQTPPAAELLPPQIGRGRSRNKVLLRWTASDANLGQTPVLLEYAPQPSGTWQKIGDWQANSGRFVWALGQGLPGKVYLRLTVKDEAGNATQTTAPEPLLIDFMHPTARIVDIEASSASPPRN